MVNVEKIRELVYGDEEYLKEFADAAVSSYTEFRDRYARAMDEGDLEELRKAGHKIKPSAQMLELEDLLDEYEKGKILLDKNSDESDRQQSVEHMTGLCNQIIDKMEEIKE